MAMDGLLDNASATSPETSWSPDAFSLDPGYLAYRNELRSIIFDTAQTTPPTREPSPEGDGHGHGNDALLSRDSAEQIETMAVLTDSRRVAYLQNYIAEVGPWLDMFDGNDAFTTKVPVLARSNPALLYAILALSARQTERQDAARVRNDRSAGSHLQSPSKQRSRPAAFDSLELYQAAIRRLTPQLQAHDPLSIPTCVVLCCLEMMSASPHDWRRHLEGCAALFDAFGVHGFCGGLLQSVFWCYARMDVCAAIISDGTEGTCVPLQKWLSPGTDPDFESEALFRSHRSPDMHANYAVFLCARTCRLIADRTQFTELGVANGCDASAFRARWLSLWIALASWIRERPLDLLPIHVVVEPPFPQILFAHWSAISSTQLYHAACIILLEARPRDLTDAELAATYLDTDMDGTVNRNKDNGNGSNGANGANGSLAVSAVPASAISAIWHAKRVCGISLTNPHRGCLNNAIQPLWVAGRLLSHRSEHEILVRLIRSIENMTGWAATWRIADLEAAWGYPSGIGS